MFTISPTKSNASKKDCQIEAGNVIKCYQHSDNNISLTTMYICYILQLDVYFGNSSKAKILSYDKESS